MDDNDKIEPVLSADEWRNLPDSYGLCVEWERLPVLIAMANNDLPDSDPRKITAYKLGAMRDIMTATKWQKEEKTFVDASAFLDALASYLPPR